MTIVLLSLSTPARAGSCDLIGTLGACSNGGQMDWDGGNGTYKFCNGSAWVSMKGSGTLGSCAGTTASTMDWVSGNYRFCDGTNWIPMATGSILSSCAGTAAGTLEYDTSQNPDTMKLCNGTNWLEVTDRQAAKCAFKTSTSYNGNLGGQASANTKCSTRASAGGLSGTYLAWIATSSASDPESLFTQASIPYRMPNGTKIADDWSDLTDGTLDAALNVNENGTTSGSTLAWTNANATGTYSGVGMCLSGSAWSQSTSGFSGGTGTTTSTSSGQWSRSFVTTQTCNLTAALYCFEQ